MRQQINLYQPIFSETRTPFSGRVVGLGFVVLIAGLAGYSVYANSKLAELDTAVAALRTEQAEQEALLASTGDEQATREKPVVIDARIKKLDQQIAERRVALKVLQSGAAGHTSGFANRMEALARRHVDGLWIDKLVLSGTNGSMRLEGSALNADTVPVYLRSLAQETVLSGTRFDEFVIERPAKQAAVIEPSLEDGEDVKPKKFLASPSHVRFRAGNTTLMSAPLDTEVAT